MNPKTTVILVVCLLIAGAALLLTREGGNPSSVDSGTHGSNVNTAYILPRAAFEPTLESIEISPDGDDRNAGTALSLMKIRGQWDVIEPGLFPANTKAIDRLLALLSGLEGQVTTTHYDKVPPMKPEELIGVQGVIPHDPPRLELYHDNQNYWSITLGPRLGAGRAVLFVSNSDKDESTYLTTTALHDFVDELDQDAYYADRFDPPLMPEVARIEIKTPEAHTALVHVNERWWIESENGLERALETGLPGHPGINNYFALLESIRLLDKQTNYPANGMASFGLEKPLISARFIPTGKDPNEPTNGYEVHVGTPADPSDQTRYISNGSSGQGRHPVFTTESKSALLLAQDATAFRDPRMVMTPKSLIASIVLKFGEGTTEWIEFPDNQSAIFHKFNSEQLPIPIDHAADLLTALTEARALAYVPLNLEAWDEWVSATIQPRLGGARESITVYGDPMSSEEMPTMLVRRGEEAVVLRVPREAVTGLYDPKSLLAEDSEDNE